MQKLLTGLAISILNLLFILGALTPGSAKAATAADFYAKKIVNVVVPFGAGGGVDYIARLFARYWPELVPGGTMVVKNMTGSGGIRGTNFIYTADPDGLTIGVAMMTTLIAPPLWKDPGVKYDPVKFVYMGTVTKDPNVFAISSKLPYKSMEEMKGVKGFKFAAVERAGLPVLGAALTADLFQFVGARIVAGYSGTKEVSLSVGRGETDGYVFPPASTVEDISAGHVKKPLMVLDTKRTKWFPDVPAVTELTHLSPQMKVFLEILKSMSEGRPFFMPPGVPQDRVQFMRNAFDKIVNLKDFKTKGMVRWSVWEDALSGDEIHALVKSAMSASEDDIAIFKKLADKYLQ